MGGWVGSSAWGRETIQVRDPHQKQVTKLETWDRGRELKKIQNKGSGWAKINEAEGKGEMSQLWLSSSSGSGPQSGATSWEWGKGVGDQPPPFLGPHSYTRTLGGARLPAHRLVGLPYRTGEAQEGPRAQAPCEGCGVPRRPSVSGGGGELQGQDLNGYEDGQEGKRSWKRWMRGPWALRLG